MQGARSGGHPFPFAPDLPDSVFQPGRVEEVVLVEDYQVHEVANSGVVAVAEVPAHGVQLLRSVALNVDDLDGRGVDARERQ